MTKKDYELIASAFYPFCTEMADGNITLSKDEKQGARVVAIKMSTTLGAKDPKFDRNKFLIACGIETHEGLGKLGKRLYG